MLQKGRHRRPAGGAQADGSARGWSQEAAQEARKEVSSLPGCVALGGGSLARTAAERRVRGCGLQGRGPRTHGTLPGRMTEYD